jgi:hypothetical protein
MWNIFKKKPEKKEFLFKYKWGGLNLDTIIYATNREKAIERFTTREVYTNIISVVEV